MFQRFEIFMKAYNTRNFSEVANQLFISQPTVSVQLKKLEEQLKITLFVRQGPKQVVPTEEADFLYSQLLTLQDEWDFMLEQLQHVKVKGERCVIACSNTCATNFLPKIFKQIQSCFPTIIFEIKQVNSDEVVELMDQHEADIGFIEKPLVHDSFNRFAIFEDHLVLAGADDAKQWLMREEESGIYYYNKRFIEEQNIHLPILKVNSNTVIVELLRAGIGKTILSRESLGDALDYDVELGYRRYFYCVTRKHPDNSEINRLNKYIEEQFSLE